MEEIEALLILSSLPGVGSVKARFLIEYFGSAADVIKASAADIAALKGFGPKIMDTWENGLKSMKWEQDFEMAEKLGAHIVPFTSPAYPKRLLSLSDFPLILFMNGQVQPEDRKCIAVVGTRRATIYGLEMAERISRDLAAAGYTVISGLALGVDTAAHIGALKSGRTIAVLGSGLSSIYPRENEQLAKDISRQGSIISEFSFNTPADRHHFPKRNRIVSGMAMATVLIEAPIRSGAMLTAEGTITQGKPVFALPGRADVDSFAGNHKMIKNQSAKLIENAQDILNYFEDLSLPLQFNLKQPLQDLDLDEIALMKKLPAVEVSIEELVQHLQLPVAKLNVLLMSLVLKKKIKEYPGKIYKKIGF